MAEELKRTAKKVPHYKHGREGRSSQGDAWMHPEVFDDNYERKTNSDIRRYTSSLSKSNRLVVDISKAEAPKTGRTLNRGKLVKRAVQVKGKDGRTFTRMQWVDPNDDHQIQSHPLHQEPSLEGTKPTSSKNPSEMSREEYVDHHVRKKMSKEEKYDMLDKHGIEWKRNNHEAIDHKNAVMALKQHLLKNPHLIGAHNNKEEKDIEKPLTGTDNENEFWNMWDKADREGSYELMRKLGIIDKDEKDPRFDPNVKENMKPIKHLLNVTRLKKYLKENRHIMTNPEYLPTKDTNATKVKKKELEDKKQGIKPSPAQAGGNDVHTILANMPREQLYKLMKDAGIADEDPLITEDKMAGVKHHLNMIKFKKHLEKHPEILTHNPDGSLTEGEKERIASLPEEAKERDRIKSFVSDMSQEDVEDALDKYSDHDAVKNRTTSDHEGINNMHAKGALVKVFSEDKERMKPYQKEVDADRLMKMRIGNKVMGKFLRHAFGFKGMGDLKRPEDDEFRTTEWQWHGNGGSGSAMMEKNDNGEAVLTVIDYGEDGQGWNESQVPLQQVKDFVDDLRKGNEQKKKVEAKEVPLQKKPADQIEKALNENFEKNYTPEVGEVMQSHFTKLWNNANRSGKISDIVKKSMNMTKGTMRSLLKEWNVPVSPTGDIIKTNDPNFKAVVFKDEIQDKKSKSAMDYLKAADIGVDRKATPDAPYDPYVLHESAKNWTEGEKAQARKELLQNAIHVKTGITHEDHDKRIAKLTDHLHSSTTHIPFDLMSHLLANGMKVKFSDVDAHGNAHTGANYNGKDNAIYLDSQYYHDKSVFKDHPHDHIPEKTEHPTIKGAKYGHWSIGENMVHESAHAIDRFLSGGDSYLNWDKGHGTTYASDHLNTVPEHYKKKVEQSNPDKEIRYSKEGKYFYVLDEWMSNYEGRVYGEYQKLNPDYVHSDNDTGKMYDKKFQGVEGMHGTEHWAESVAGYGNAIHSYQRWKDMNPGKKDTSMDDWAEQMHKQYSQKGFGTANSEGQNYKVGTSTRPMESYGWQYHTMKQHYPELFGAMQSIFNRPDFLGQKGQSRTESIQHGTSAKKSLGLFVDLGGSKA